MLVLTVRQGESVHIGDATIEVLAIRGGQVKLGFNAPAAVPIRRENARQKLPSAKVTFIYAHSLERKEESPS